MTPPRLPQIIRPGQQWQGRHPVSGRLSTARVLNVLGVAIEVVFEEDGLPIALHEASLRSPRWRFIADGE